jgi:hypothetical protein
MDGNEDVGEDGKFSHCGESVGSPPLVVPERRAGALQLADRGWSCWEKGMIFFFFLIEVKGKKKKRQKDAQVAGSFSLSLVRVRVHARHRRWGPTKNPPGM